MSRLAMPSALPADIAERLSDRAEQEQEIDFDDEHLMKQLCGERLAKPVERLLVLRAILHNIPDHLLRVSLKDKLDALHDGVKEAAEDTL